ncbi:MAG TPA: NADH-quinone oxidoreductase subunit L [Gemmatimonadaceae bacterium]|nr:NADH-quinone oxidoreductase subunit L [Gemmatimonadaceae bacterium]
MALLQSSAGHPLDGSLAEWLWLLPVLPLAGAVVNGAVAISAARLHAAAATSSTDAGSGAGTLAGRSLVSLVGPGVLLAAFALALGLFAAMRGAGDLAAPFVRSFGTWMPVGELQIAWALQLDQLSMLMTLVITGVGFLIHVFSVGYMAEDTGFARYFAYLNLFVAMMLVLVLGASYPVMFVGWEGVGLASYLLIGFWFGERANADAGRKAFIVNRIGDFGFLVAMFLVFAQTGTLDYVGAHAALATAAPGVLTAIALFLFLGCTGKSAQIPLYLWLPDAMAGPTPVSALIHAATMVTAGVYLIARASAVFAGAPSVSLLVTVVGAVTALFAATIALRQWDIKKVLAYSTVSQLGYMFVGVGTGAYAAGVFHLVTHAFFKALLFLGAGAVIHAMHAAYHHAHDHASDAQDMRNMGGLSRHLPRTALLMWVATLAIAGVPPLAGFFSKDVILTSAFARAHGSPLADATLLGVPGSAILYVVYALGLVTALLTAVYMTRLMLLTFTGANRTGERAAAGLHEAPALMGVPLAVLGVLTVIGGWLNLPAVLPLGPSHLLADWLAPVTGVASQALAGEAHLSHATEYALIGTAIGTAVLGIVFAVLRYRQPVPRAVDAPAEQGVAALLHDAYRVDAGVDRAIVRPLAWLSASVLWRGIDRAIEGAYVHGSAALARVTGAAHDWIGRGDVGRYAWAFTIGLLLMLAAFTVR